MIDEDHAAVLHAIRVHGSAPVAAIAEWCRLAADAAGSLVDDLVSRGLVRERKGRIGGVQLTDGGTAAHAEWLDATLDIGQRSALAAFDERFVALNERLKEICTSWQLRPGAELVLNDHRDSAYDGEVLDRLGALHDEVSDALDTVTSSVHRFGHYRSRLDTALHRARGGDPDAVARPMSPSYHDVWMRLHTDVLVSMGRARIARDGY